MLRGSKTEREMGSGIGFPPLAVSGKGRKKLEDRWVTTQKNCEAGEVDSELLGENGLKHGQEKVEVKAEPMDRADGSRTPAKPGDRLPGFQEAES